SVPASSPYTLCFESFQPPTIKTYFISFTQTCKFPSFICLSHAVSFHRPFVAKIPRLFWRLLIFLGSVQRNHGNLALFFEWPTFYQDDFYQQAILLFVCLNVRCQWLGTSVFQLDYGLDVIPYFRSL